MKKIIAMLFGLLIFMVMSPPGNAKEAQSVDKTLIIEMSSMTINQVPAVTPVMVMDMEISPCVTDPVFNLIRTDNPIEAEATDTPTVRKYLSRAVMMSYDKPTTLTEAESRLNCSSRFN